MIGIVKKYAVIKHPKFEFPLSVASISAAEHSVTRWNRFRISVILHCLIVACYYACCHAANRLTCNMAHLIASLRLLLRFRRIIVSLPLWIACCRSTYLFFLPFFCLSIISLFGVFVDSTFMIPFQCASIQVGTVGSVVWNAGKPDKGLIDHRPTS